MPMTVKETKAVFAHLEQAMNSRRLEDLDKVIAPNFVRHCQATPHLDIRNREQFKDFLRQDALAFPDNVQSFRHVLVDGDMAPRGPTSSLAHDARRPQPRSIAEEVINVQRHVRAVRARRARSG